MTNTFTIADLYDIAATGTPIDRSYDRSRTRFFLVPNGVATDSGHVPAVELQVRHDKDRKRYTADISLASIKVVAHGFSQSFSIGGGRLGETFYTEPAARFSAAKFAAVQAHVDAMVIRFGRPRV